MTMAKTKPVQFESNPFKVIFWGFDKLFKHNQTMAIVLLAVSVFSSFGQFFDYGVGDTPGSSTSSESSPASAALVGAIVVMIIIFIAAAIFIGTMINGIMSYVAYATSKHQTVTFSQSIKAVWEKFWTILWIEVLVVLRVLGGTLLFIIPGIRAALRYDMALFPVFEGNANAEEAIAKSKAVTKDHLLEIFGMSVAAGIIPFVGQLFKVGGQAIMYPQLKALHESGAPKPKVHWLNYLGFILLGGLVLLIVLVASIITVAGN
jgi:hypothetical protein